jgi:Gas vesicle synthesis protein GvpL/GvpF
MSFGIIADSPRAIEKILSRNHEAFLKQLLRVAGMVEMGLRVSWDVPNIFEYFINTHPGLRAGRDRFLGPYGNPAQEDKIELGRMFDRLLNEDRETHTEKVEEILSNYCREIKRNKCRHESEVMSLPCLVPRYNQDRFEEGVFAAAKLFDSNFTFDFSGPWAPHNFVDLELEL